MHPSSEECALCHEDPMKPSRITTINGFLILGLSLWMGLLISCTCSFCDVAEAQIASAAPMPAASYDDATTTVGTSLVVTPNRAGAPITGATVSAGIIPPGMTLHADGSISGTPTQAGVYPLEIQLCSAGQCIIRPVVITVNTAAADPINAQYTNAATVVGTPLSVPPTVIVGGPTTSAVVAQGTVPPGMALNAISGVVAGTPTTAGVFPLTINLGNASGGHVAVPVTITVSQSGSTALAATYTNTAGPVGTPMTVAPNVTTGGPVVSSTLVSGTIPPGMTLGTNGSIYGTPTTPGTYTAEIALRNASGALTTQSVTITVYASGTTSILANYVDLITMVGSTVTVDPTVANGGPVVGATVITGSLPPGLTLNLNGTITGTATTSGLYTMVIRLCNASGACLTVPLTIIVNNLPLALSYATPKTFALGSAITTQAPTLVNPAPALTTTYVVTTGSLPQGLTLNTDGTISGSPATAGVYPFVVTATNGARTATANLIYTVLAAPAASYTDTTTTFGTPTTKAPVSTGGTITAATITAGGVAGITVASDGTITVASTTAIGTYNLTINACNAVGVCVSVPAKVIVNPAAPAASYTDTTTTFGTATTKAPVSTGGTITAATITAGGAAGISVASDGTITVANTTAIGTYNLTVNVCNAVGVCVSVPAKVIVNPAAPAASYTDTTTTFGTATTKAPVSTGGTITAATITAGGVAGITVAADGTITVASTTAIGTYNLTVDVCNAVGVCVSVPAKVIVNPAAPAASYTDTTTAFGTPTTKAPVNTGGTITAATITAGGVPGITIASDGTITVANTTAIGTYNLTINVCNSVGVCVSVPAKVIVNPVAPAATYSDTTTTFGTATTKAPVSTGGTITAATITAGGVAGITVASDGTITVANTTAIGTYNLTVNVCNAVGVCVSVPAKVIVLVAAPSALNYATPVVYTTTVSITNNPNPTGGTPTSYSIVGSLPAGLTLDPTTGIISGTPTTPTVGAVSVTITGTNATGSAFLTLSITVVAYPTANLSSNPSVVPVGQSSSLTALFTGSSNGTAVLTGDGIVTPITVTSGTSVPTGIVNIAGTTRNYTLTVTNAVGVIATSNVSVQWIAIPADTWTVTIPTAGGGPYAPGVGNLLNGQIFVTVPNQGQSTCGSVTLTVNKETPLPGPILASARDYSNTFNIASNLGYPFRVPITITLKYDPTLASPNLVASDLPVPFYWDPSYSKWVATGFKSIDTVNHLVTFTTLLPGRYTVLGIPGLTLATQNLSFLSGTDDWRQNNPSVYDLPGGASLGMGSFASWYFPFKKAANGGVGLFSQFPTVADVNAQALISRLANGTMDSWEYLWNQQAYSLTDKQTGQALVTGLMVTGQPQIFLMGDTRPVINTAVATAVYAYDNATGKFSVMDPNYPGNALTITWNSGTGAFSAYDRAAGYSPALAKFAFEGQTSIHRLADYDRVFSGASTGFPTAVFATISVTDINGQTNPDVTQAVTVASASNVTISGTVTNGDENATHIYWSQNGDAPRNAVPLTPLDATHSSFSFTISALADPFGTTVVLETTATPCDPTFSHSGFLKFVVKQASLLPWFQNACFENGLADPAPWVLEQGSNNTIPYPAIPGYSTTTGQFTNYGIVWNQIPADSALIHSAAHIPDANVNAIASVLDGDYSFMVNNPANGAHISRMYQTVTVPTTVARPKLSFYWAAAMQSANHIPSQLPYVDILVQDADNHYETLYTVHHYPPSTVGATTYTDGYPGWIAGNGTGGNKWYGINWQQVNLNLGSGRGGHHLVITVMAADCTQTGHGGYAYIDSIGCQ